MPKQDADGLAPWGPLEFFHTTISELIQKLVWSKSFTNIGTYESRIQPLEESIEKKRGERGKRKRAEPLEATRKASL